MDVTEDKPVLTALVADFKVFGRHPLTVENIPRARALIKYLEAQDADAAYRMFIDLLNECDPKIREIESARVLLGVDHPHADVSSRMRLIVDQWDVEERTVRRWAYAGYAMIARHITERLQRPFAYMFIRMEQLNLAPVMTFKVVIRYNTNVTMTVPYVSYINWQDDKWLEVDSFEEASERLVLSDRETTFTLRSDATPTISTQARYRSLGFNVAWTGELVPRVAFDSYTIEPDLGLHFSTFSNDILIQGNWLGASEA